MENVFGFNNYKIVGYNNVKIILLILTMNAMPYNYQQNVQLMVITVLRYNNVKTIHHRLVVIWESMVYVFGIDHYAD